MPVNNPRGAERGLVCRVGDATALSCHPNKDGIFCWGGRKKPSAIDPEGALLTTRGRLASPTSAVRYIRREGRLWVKGGSRRQTDGGPVCPQLRKCRLRPGSYARCHERTPNRYSKSEAHTLSPADPS